MSLTSKLKSILDSASTERPLLSWFKRNPLVLTHTFAFSRYLAAEFPFGTDFRADFVALGPFSGGWDIHFIDAWRIFIEHNRNCVLRDLSKFVQKRELIFGDRDSEPIDNCGWQLYHPQSYLHWHFQIIIGRRHQQSNDQIQRKTSFRKHHEIEILTYDRTLEAAKKLDDYHRQCA